MLAELGGWNLERIYFRRLSVDGFNKERASDRWALQKLRTWRRRGSEYTYSVHQLKALPAGIRQQWAGTLDRIGGKLVSNSFESHLEKTNLRFPVRNSSPDIILVGVRHSTSKIDRRKFLWMKRAIRK